MNEDESANAEEGPVEQVGGKPVDYELLSVREAAEVLRVSESSVWRYADQDLLPAYRIGPKRVMFRSADLESFLYRMPRRKKRPVMDIRERLRLTAMNDGMRRDAGELIARAAGLRAEILARRGGVVTSASWEDIDASREERSADL